MGSDTIPDRSNGSPITQDWYNVIRNVLNLDFYPRNSSGMATDQAGSLGSATYRWLYAYLLGLYLYNGSRFIQMVAPSGLAADYAITLPSALPVSGNKGLFINSSGVASLSIAPDDSTLEISGSSFRVKDLGITRAKLAALGQQLSSSCAAYSAGAGTGLGAITNLSVTIATQGRPIWLGLISDGSGNASYVQNADYIVFKRDSTEIARPGCFGTIPGPSSGYQHTDVPSDGTYTYTAHAFANASNGANVTYAKLLAFRL